MRGSREAWVSGGYGEVGRGLGARERRGGSGIGCWRVAPSAFRSTWAIGKSSEQGGAAAGCAQFAARMEA
jgi:hypothetical protein